VSGRKLWVLFPPHVDKNVAKGKDVIRQGEDDEPVRSVAPFTSCFGRLVINCLSELPYELRKHKYYWLYRCDGLTMR